MTDANQKCSLGGFGARLKAAREAMNYSQKEAAARLHLNPTILHILETEDFQKAPPATFMRGYLRSYAKLLNFNEDDINAALNQSGLETQTRTLVVPMLETKAMPVSDRHVQWVSTMIVLGLFVFIGAWWEYHSSSTQTNRYTLLHSPKINSSQPVKQPEQPKPIPTITATSGPAAPLSSPSVASIAEAGQSTAQPTLQSTSPSTNQPAITSAAPVEASQPVTQVPVAAAPTPPLPAATTSAANGSPVPTLNAISSPLAPPEATSPVTTAPAEQNTAVASADSPKKHRHHRQEGSVSGLSMALPEPGL